VFEVSLKKINWNWSKVKQAVGRPMRAQVSDMKASSCLHLADSRGCRVYVTSTHALAVSAPTFRDLRARNADARRFVSVRGADELCA
jgi:hypothetical protein